MEPSVSLIASGLNLLTFQGVTLSQGVIVVATIEGDLLRIQPNGSVASWVNLSRYGVPAGIVDRNGTIGVVLSAQEVGHALVQVAAGGQVSQVADLSDWAGEFGAPFGVAVQQGYCSDYVVTIATDVVRSIGLVVRVTLSGQVSRLATLASSPFGIVAQGNRLFVTQQNGQLLQISAGKVTSIANLIEANLGIPLGVTGDREGCVVTTNAGWLVRVVSDSPDPLLPLVNVLEAGFGIPGSIACFNNGWVVATSGGNLLYVE